MRSEFQANNIGTRSMKEFPIAHTEKAYRFCQWVKEALCTFEGKSETDAIALINQYWKRRQDVEDDPLLYHESPYYYAMCIAHHPSLGDKNLEWHKDPSKWPPPDGWAFE